MIHLCVLVNYQRSIHRSGITHFVWWINDQRAWVSHLSVHLSGLIHFECVDQLSVGVGLAFFHVSGTIHFVLFIDE